jgi:hypothetical protein
MSLKALTIFIDFTFYKVIQNLIFYLNRILALALLKED